MHHVVDVMRYVGIILDCILKEIMLVGSANSMKHCIGNVFIVRSTSFREQWWETADFLIRAPERFPLRLGQKVLPIWSIRLDT